MQLVDAFELEEYCDDFEHLEDGYFFSDSQQDVLHVDQNLS